MERQNRIKREIKGKEWKILAKKREKGKKKEISKENLMLIKRNKNKKR